MHTSGNSSIDTSLIRDIYCGPEVLFETCVAMKFVDDDDDDDSNVNTSNGSNLFKQLMSDVGSSKLSKPKQRTSLSISHQSGNTGLSGSC